MPVRIEWPLKSVGYIAAGGGARRSHRLGCPETADARATKEKYLRPPVRTEGCKRLAQALDKCRVDAIVREALPLHEDRPLVDGRQIRKAYVGPFRNRTHVDQHGCRVA